MKTNEAVSMRSRVEEYAKEKYHHEPEQMPFGQEDYAVLRHPGNGMLFLLSRAEMNLVWTVTVMPRY